MSISLNDHEIRIKALENKSYRFKCDILFDGYIKIGHGQTKDLSGDFTSYELLSIWYSAQGTHRTDESDLQVTIPVSALSSGIDCYAQEYVDSYTQGYKISLVGNDLRVTSRYFANKEYPAIKRIVGLKIYYIFRYNICEILKLISPILKF